MSTKKITSANALKREREGGGGRGNLFKCFFLKRKMELLLIQTK